MKWDITAAVLFLVGAAASAFNGHYDTTFLSFCGACFAVRCALYRLDIARFFRP